MKPVKLNAVERDLVKRYRKLSHESQMRLMSVLEFQEGLDKCSKTLMTIINNYPWAVENLAKPDDDELHWSCTNPVINKDEHEQNPSSRFDSIRYAYPVDK